MTLNEFKIVPILIKALLKEILSLFRFGSSILGLVHENVNEKTLYLTQMICNFKSKIDRRRGTVTGKPTLVLL